MARVSEPPVTELGRLIREVVEANPDWSQTTVADNAQRRHRDLSKQTVSAFVRKPLHSISRDNIEALAVGLDIPARRVARAAMESLGYPPDPELTSREALMRDVELSSAMRRVLVAALDVAHTESRRIEAVTVTDDEARELPRKRSSDRRRTQQRPGSRRESDGSRG